MPKPSGLILPPGPDGRCDDYRLGGATVDFDGGSWAGSGRWRMWYYCRDKAFNGPATLGTGRIALATSPNGIDWPRVDGPLTGGAVMEPSTAPHAFDALHIGITDVLRRDDGWIMAYFGGDHGPRTCLNPAVGTMAGLGMRCGLAYSADGLHWQRMAGSENNGALFDYAPDQLYAAWPNLFHDGERYILQYTAPTLDLGLFRTFVATSADCRDWQQLGALQWDDAPQPYDAGGIVTRQVLLNPLPGHKRFLMIYTAVNASHGRSIAAAHSDDGRVWSRIYGEPIFGVGAAGAWDCLGVAANRLVVAHDRLFFYYYGFQSLGNDEGARGIGLATGPLNDLRQLRRWTGG